MPAPYPPQPLTLTGDLVSLEPLTALHAEPLAEAAHDGRLWELWYTSVPRPEDTGGWIDAALRQQQQGRALPFAVRSLAHDRIVGSTRYMNIEGDRRRLEIGSTWYAQSHQRSAINTECKRLLLHYAFDQLGCMAVEFRTHFFNFRSREAIAKLGAKQDGILRNHMLTGDGNLRDTVVFSIISDEWPTVRRHLDHRLARLRAGAVQ